MCCYTLRPYLPASVIILSSQNSRKACEVLFTKIQSQLYVRPGGTPCLKAAPSGPIKMA